MTIYTVNSCDLPFGGREPLPLGCAGSYTNKAAAAEALADYVMERLRLGRDDLAKSMYWDVNHPGAREFLIVRPNHGSGVRRGCLRKLRALVLEAAKRDGRYYVNDNHGGEWLFDIHENQLGGDAWTLITWGDSDVEDPEFTTPWPETFTSAEAAVENAVAYARDLMDSHDFSAADQAALLEYLRHELTAGEEKNGARLDLSDGAAVHWALYHFGMEKEGGDGKVHG